MAIIFAKLLAIITRWALKVIRKHWASMYQGNICQAKFKSPLALHLVNNTTHVTLPLVDIPFPSQLLRIVHAPKLCYVAVRSSPTGYCLFLKWIGSLTYKVNKITKTMFLPNNIHLSRSLIKMVKKMVVFPDSLTMSILTTDPVSYLSDISTAFSNGHLEDEDSTLVKKTRSPPPYNALPVDDNHDIELHPTAPPSKIMDHASNNVPSTSKDNSSTPRTPIYPRCTLNSPISTSVTARLY